VRQELDEANKKSKEEEEIRERIKRENEEREERKRIANDFADLVEIETEKLK